MNLYRNLHNLFKMTNLIIYKFDNYRSFLIQVNNIQEIDYF